MKLGRRVLAGLAAALVVVLVGTSPAAADARLPTTDPGLNVKSKWNHQPWGFLGNGVPYEYGELWYDASLSRYVSTVRYYPSATPDTPTQVLTASGFHEGTITCTDSTLAVITRSVTIESGVTSVSNNGQNSWYVAKIKWPTCYSWETLVSVNAIRRENTDSLHKPDESWSWVIDAYPYNYACDHPDPDESLNCPPPPDDTKVPRPEETLVPKYKDPYTPPEELQAPTVTDRCGAPEPPVWGDLSWIPETTALYADCLFVPTTTFHAEGLYTAMDGTGLGDIQAMTSEISSLTFEDKGCGVIYDHAISVFEGQRMTLSTCDRPWTDAGPLKFLLGIAFTIGTGFAVLHIVTRALGIRTLVTAGSQAHLVKETKASAAAAKGNK